MGRKINSGLSIGVHGQLSFENFELINKLNDQASVGDLVLNHPSNNYLKIFLTEMIKMLVIHLMWLVMVM